MPSQSMDPFPSARCLRNLVLLTACTASSVALAQASVCERYQAELASLNRSGAAVQRQRGEIERLAAYYRSIGCDQGGFFSFLRRPAECGPIAQRVRALQAGYQTLAAQASVDPSEIESRRRQLRAAIDRSCSTSTESELVQGTRAKGGERLVCVRSCDGAYFPLDAQPKEHQSHASLCSALCPQADVQVFRAPVDGRIEEAVSESGEPYMKLPHALRYRQAYDPSCSCKKRDESWAQALRKAEALIARKKTDVVVTETLSDTMARAKIEKARSRPGKDDGAQAKPSLAHAAPIEPETTGSAPEHEPATPPQPGKLRIIAPDVIPVPDR